jgi:phosphate starvation-inducible PhoH-like protein
METTLQPEDNHRLANLCGALDENIKQIESALDVSIARRGAHFRFTGELENKRLAKQIIEKFYAQSKSPIGLEEIQLGLVEINKLKPEEVIVTNMPTLMTRRGDLHGRTPRQVAYLQQIQDYDISFGIGPAGTGKTYLAVASAVDAMTRDKVKRIVLVRPAVEAGERLGFLPGDLNQKVDPYLRPLYDALYDLAGYDTVNKMFERGAIEVAPLAYMRGRTLNQSFIILDEAQNTTPEQMKMFLTRIGFGTKAVITGDVTQIDLGRGQKSGLVEAQQVLKDIRGIAFTQFLSDDVVRHPLVQKIVTAYEKYDAAKHAQPHVNRHEQSTRTEPESKPNA